MAQIVLSHAHLRAVAWVVPCVLAWGLIPRLASATGNLDPGQYLFWSSLVSAACLAISARVLGHWPALMAYSAVDVRRLVALSSLGAYGYYALLYTAYAPCPGPCPDKAPIIIVAQYTWPALSVAWSTVLLGERLTRRVVLSLGLGIAAVALVASTSPSSSGATTKIPVVLLAAAVFGLYSTLLKKIDYEPFSSLAVTFAAAAALSGASALASSGSLGWPRGEAIWAVAVNGVFVNGLSYVCWYRALRAAPMAVVAPWVALTPLAAVLLSTSVTAPTPAQWLGVALVLLSVMLALPASRAGSASPSRAALGT
jgi:drug/metabolite transporter (DMT)-like permease